MNHCVDSHTALQLNELLYALKQLHNDKTPGMDGLSKEVLVQFWDIVFGLMLQTVNDIWDQQCMDPMLKQEIIKLLPKQKLCTNFSHERPTTMMGIAYKLFTKDVARNH